MLRFFFVAYPKSSSKAKQATALIVEWPTEEPPHLPTAFERKITPDLSKPSVNDPYSGALCLLVRLRARLEV